MERLDTHMTALGYIAGAVLLLLLLGALLVVVAASADANGAPYYAVSGATCALMFIGVIGASIIDLYR
jgi:hypothetical protein